LKKGGNAIDAAVATGFVLTVVKPSSNSIGGVNWIVVRLADGETAIILGAGKAPMKAAPDMYELEPEGFGPYFRKVKDDANVIGHRSVAIPGLVAGFATLLEKYGTMDWEEVLQPAIRYAEEGFVVSILDIVGIAQRMEIILRYRATAEILLRNGFPPKLGRRDRWDGSERIVQRDLAESLRKIAEGGPEAFYRGEIAEAIVGDMEEHGGLMTDEDLATYEPWIVKPTPVSYRGHEVIYAHVITAGPLVMETLNILEGFDLGALGHNTPETLHLLAEAMGLAYSDYYQYVGDPNFVAVPSVGLSSKEYAAERRELIDLEKASVSVKPGDPWPHEGESTTHQCVVDKEGNVTSITQTLGGGFGSFVTVPGTGIILNDQMWGFNPEPGHANSVAPGKWRVAPTAPTIIAKDGVPLLSVGAPGGGRIPLAVTQVIMNVIDHGLGIQAAIEAPRIDRGSTLSMPDEIVLDSRIGEPTREALSRLGHKVFVVDEQPWVPGGSVNFAVPVGILIDPKTGRLHGGVDPYRIGAAVGY